MIHKKLTKILFAHLLSLMFAYLFLNTAKADFKNNYVNFINKPVNYYLPYKKIFIGDRDFDKIVKKAIRKKWYKLPISQRMVLFGMEFVGRPYKGLTLEVDTKIEAPSANLKQLDCWTFFEIALGFSRMIVEPKKSFKPVDLLRNIEFTRYRGGKCYGNYLDRIHYLAEWYFENQARGVIKNFSRDFGGILMKNRKCREMTILWQYYPYLKHNKSLLGPMGKHEERISQLPVYYIPKTKVKYIEKKLKNGDIIGIVTNHQGGFCSHVGMLLHTKKQKARLLHASSDEKKVILDTSISRYLYRYKKHAGILVGRPLEVKHTVFNRNKYYKNLATSVGGFHKIASIIRE